MNKFLMLGIALGAVFMFQAIQPAEALIIQPTAPSVQQTHIIQAQYYYGHHHHWRHHHGYYGDPYGYGYRDDYRYERGPVGACVGPLCVFD